jgi:PAS domain S-box-containing protein
MRTTPPAPAGLPLYQKYCYSGLDTAVMETLPVAIYKCEKNGDIAFYNSAAVQLWGRRPDVTSDKWSGAYKVYTAKGELLGHGNALFQDMDTAISPAPEEIIVERPDGSVTFILVHASPVYDGQGTVLGSLYTLIDISEKRSDDASWQLMLARKNQENRLALEKSEERYHKMVDEVQDYAILLLDRNGYILNWNKGAEKIKGYTEAEIIGQNFRKFYLPEDIEKKLPEKLIEEAVTNGRSAHEGWRLRKDGTKFWASMVITALHDDDNNTIGFSKVTRDLTERKLAEDTLRNNARDIEFRNKQLEEYAYVASHDLQEPLRKIQVFSEMLMDSLDDREELVRYIDKISASAGRMTTLIKDVLKYSQLSSSDELFEETSLNVVLDNILEDFDLLVEQRKVQLQIGVLPVIKAVPIQMHQLFSNLLSNAIKFSSQTPVISITAETPTAEDIAEFPLLGKGTPYTKIVFKDNGQGFDQEYADQVFKMFKRLDQTPGTGIGLALCKKITENHNGCITVQSKPGEGAVFSIFLPLL